MSEQITVRRLLSLPIEKDNTPYRAVDVLHQNGRHFFIADCDIDCDGPNGNPDGDPYWQPETTLRYKGKSIDSYKVAGIVLPPSIIRAVKPAVLGCKARITNLKNLEPTDAVVYDIGPTRKLGEASVLAAKRIGVNSNPNIGGEDDYDAILYEFWPGESAIVDGVTYELQLYR